MRDYLSSYVGSETAVQATPKLLTKPPKPSSVSFVSLRSTRIQQKTSAGKPVLVPPKAAPTRVVKPAPKPKVWRREPYYPPCVTATMENSQIQRRAADEFFAALAVIDGHEPDYIAEMLRLVSPAISSTANYCQEIVKNADANRGVILTEARVSLYIEHHPFAWELQLSSTLKRGSLRAVIPEYEAI